MGAKWGERALVTFVPRRKNTPSSMNGKLHGWAACAAAVRPATTRPAGVKLLWLCALYSRAAIAGAAMAAFIASLLSLFVSAEICVIYLD